MDYFKCCHTDSCSRSQFESACEFYHNDCNYTCDDCENYDSINCSSCDHKDYFDGFEQDSDYD